MKRSTVFLIGVLMVCIHSAQAYDPARDKERERLLSLYHSNATMTRVQAGSISEQRDYLHPDENQGLDMSADGTQNQWFLSLTSGGF
jgi:hypothetical protein